MNACKEKLLGIKNFAKRQQRLVNSFLCENLAKTGSGISIQTFFVVSFFPFLPSNYFFILFFFLVFLSISFPFFFCLSFLPSIFFSFFVLLFSSSFPTRTVFFVFHFYICSSVFRLNWLAEYLTNYALNNLKESFTEKSIFHLSQAIYVTGCYASKNCHSRFTG